MAEPILKWAGGKRQIIHQVLDCFPRDYKKRRFHEPMVGAGAITFAIEPLNGSINDTNVRLMNLYNVVKQSPLELIEWNKRHRYDKEYYYWARDRFNSKLVGQTLDDIEDASLFLYLNRTCWNGLYRVNQKGQFNVPIGVYSKPNYLLKERILSASKILKRLDIIEGDFDYILDVAKSGDIVYFDPPYQASEATSIFTAYNKDGFDFKEQIRLKETMAELSARGVFVILSNSDAPKLNELYSELDSFDIVHTMARRTINSVGTGRGKVGEIIVTNVPRDERLAYYLS